MSAMNMLPTARYWLGELMPLAALAGLITGCQGPVGPSGKDVEGVDVSPPTVVLSEPWPLSELWDEAVVTASAVDNVAIREVLLLVDGSSLYQNRLLSFTSSPYSARLDLSVLEPGWHFLSARAYDTAGNEADTPEIPVKVGMSSSLRDTVVHLSYYALEVDSVIGWRLPDSAHSTSYWTRFSIARDCFLRRCSLILAGAIGDTDTVAVEIWMGDELPNRKTAREDMYAYELSDEFHWCTVEFGDPGLRLTDDFFLMISLKDTGEPDTIRLGSDKGVPYWGRSGCGDDTGYYTLRNRYARKNNLLMECEVFYRATEAAP